MLARSLPRFALPSCAAGAAIVGLTWHSSPFMWAFHPPRAARIAFGQSFLAPSLIQCAPKYNEFLCSRCLGVKPRSDFSVNQQKYSTHICSACLKPGKPKLYVLSCSRCAECLPRDAFSSKQFKQLVEYLQRVYWSSGQNKPVASNRLASTRTRQTRRPSS